ncbi:MAG: hypothetical protein EOP83_13335 [Verrucomicrobiaceae bacterium]|nr:MAG: hypothetical protein EOP83_13335 [Verrucomicrobiaceae bacterium]
MNCRLLLSCLLATGLPSCGLVKLPFRVVGAAADVGKAGYKSTKKAFSKSPEEKAKEKKEKEEKAKKEAEEEKAKRAAETNQHSDATKQQQDLLKQPPASPTQTGDTLPPLPPDNTPLPNDAPLPYQGQ